MHTIKMSYIDFTQVQVSKELSSSFVKDCHGKNLSKIILDKKNSIKLSFFAPVGNNQVNVYLVMIIGNNDFNLAKLGKLYGFPRGFPIIWVPGKKIQYFGFYPKFENDDRQTPENLKEFENLTDIRFFKKWSGFLGQMIFFEIDKNKYWTVTSKNSAEYKSPFTMSAKNIFKKYITDNLIDIMIKDNLHLCAEVISFNDQVHGARVIEETALTVAIGSGCIYYLDNSKNASITQKQFVSFYDHKSLVEFCVKNNLPCDSAVSINSSSHDSKNKAFEFIRELSDARDFMTDEKMETLIGKYVLDNSARIEKGTVTHKQILGDCLEGIVIFAKFSDGNTVTKKYKFPNYTIRTMLLRTQLGDKVNEYVFSKKLANHTRNFVENWCVTDLGKEYWYRFGLCAFVNFHNDQNKYCSVGNPPNNPENNNLVAKHILLAEQTIITDNIQEQFDKLSESIQEPTVFLILGPIGLGKTTYANYLSKIIPNAVHIDGDDLDLDSATVLKLGPERNNATISLICEKLISGKVPIISTGGGALMGYVNKYKEDFMLRYKIQKILHINPKIVSVVIGDFPNITKLDTSFDTKNIFTNPQFKKMTEKTVYDRIQNGSWTVDKKFLMNIPQNKEYIAIANFTNFIVTKSEENYKIANRIIHDSQHVYGIPALSKDNYDKCNLINFTELVDQTVNMGPVENFNLTKIYGLAVTEEDCVLNLQIKYDYDGKLQMSLKELHELKNRMANIGKGTVVTFVSSNNSEKMILWVPDFAIPDNSNMFANMRKECLVNMKECDKLIRMYRESGGQVKEFDIGYKEKRMFRVESEIKKDVRYLGVYFG